MPNYARISFRNGCFHITDKDSEVLRATCQRMGQMLFALSSIIMEVYNIFGRLVLIKAASTVDTNIVQVSIPIPGLELM